MKNALLFALPGTSDADASRAMRNVERLARERYPDAVVRWAYTSRGVRAKLAARGQPADDPAAALARLHGEGVARVAVRSLHMVEGMEYGELRDAVTAWAERGGGFERIALSPPILDEPGLFPAMAAELLREIPLPEGEGAALVLAAHGSREPAARAGYARAAAWCRESGRPVVLGTILPPLELADVVAWCRAAGVRRAVLTPFTVAAGPSVMETLAGDGPDSWRARLEQEGIRCQTQRSGLGERDAVARLWLDRLPAL
jgi:sirohydrochlorin cobaltochelatase